MWRILLIWYTGVVVFRHFHRVSTAARQKDPINNNNIRKERIAAATATATAAAAVHQKNI